MKKLLLGALVAFLPLTGFAATILGIQVGTGSWEHDPSGAISTTADGAGITADLKNDLNLAEESEGYTYFSVEHPVPLIPNFKYVNTNLTSSGTGAVNFTFNGTPYGAVGVNTKLDLTHTDYILYYEILDNDLVSVDVGVNAKQIDGQAVVDADTVNFSETIPMLYAAAEIGLPAGLSLVGEISSLSTGGDTITDITAKVTYTTDFNLGVEAGIRSIDIDIDADTIKANMEFSGVFAGVYFKF